MKFKNTARKSTSGGNKSAPKKSSLKKDEIKEIVEATVEQVLEKQGIIENSTQEENPSLREETPTVPETSLSETPLMGAEEASEEKSEVKADEAPKEEDSTKEIGFTEVGATDEEPKEKESEVAKASVGEEESKPKQRQGEGAIFSDHPFLPGVTPESTQENLKPVGEEVKADESTDAAASPGEIKLDTSPTPVSVDGAKTDDASTPKSDEASVVAPVEQSGFSGTPKEEPKKHLHFAGILIALIAFGLAVGGGLWYLTSHNINSISSLLPGAKPTPTIAPVATATPTTAQLDVGQYKVSVLNGSEVAGEAAKVKTLLTDAGFNVTTTGNAASTDFVQTVIYAKSTVSQDALIKLVQVLSQQYSVSTHAVTLNDSQSIDIIVTIGSGKK